MNFQACHNVAFVGLNDSYEQLYQAVRRCWRFGQEKPVNVHIVCAQTEGQVIRNIQRKEKESEHMMEQIVENMKGLQLTQEGRREMDYSCCEWAGQGWTIRQGDSVDLIKEIPDNSVGLLLTSPPFPGMYAYSNSMRDIGNSTQILPMIEHFKYLIPEIHRIMMPGRMVCIHMMQLTAMKNRDGYIGVKDYRGAIIDAFEIDGLHYAGEVTIDKNPQVQAVRNKERGLLFKTLATDSANLRMALADYLLYFRKEGENPAPICAGLSDKYNPGGEGWITENEWVEWAAPVWYRHTKDRVGGIRETDVLNVIEARESNDERHLCPLQLGVCERAIKLWSAPGDTVLDLGTGCGIIPLIPFVHFFQSSG